MTADQQPEPNALDRLERATASGTWVLSLEPPQTLWWSAGTRRLFEWPDDRPVPPPEEAFQTYTEASQAVVRNAVARAMESHQPFEFIAEAITALGRHRFVRCTAVVEQRDGRAVLAGTLQDIDRLYRAEANAERLGIRLGEFEERWRLAIESSELGVWDWDAAANTVYFSDQWKAMLGYAPDEVGDTLAEWDSRLHPDDREHCYADLTAHLEGRTPEYRNEHRVRCKDGRYKWILDRGRVITRGVDGKPLRVVGTHADIDRQKFIEDVAQQASARFEGIFNAMYQFIGILSPDGVLMEANEAAIGFAGVPRSELIGRPFWECHWWQVGEATQAQLRAAIARAVAGKTLRYEVEVQGVGGVRVTIDFSLKPVRDERGEVVQIISEGRDISEQVAARQALDERERLFRATFDGAPIGTAIVGLDGRWMEVNAALCEIVGYPRAELLRLTFQDITHPEDLDADLENVQALIRGEGSHYTMEKRYFRKDGSEVPVQLDVTIVLDTQGRPLNFLSQIQDITERRRAQQALHVEKRLAQDSLAAIADGVIRTDRAGRITLANPAALTLLGMTEPALLQAPFCETVHPRLTHDGPTLASPVQQVLATGQPVLLEMPSLRLLRPNAEALAIEVACTPLFEAPGTPSGCIVVMRDVSASRQREQALEQARVAAEAGTRAKSEFLANMSHEIRTPLNAMLGMLELLQRSPLNTDQADYADKARTASETLLGVLNDVLDLSKIEAGRLTLSEAPFKLERLFRELGSILASTARDKRIEVLFDLAADLPPRVVGDRLRLLQILLNVGGNAVKFTEQGHVLFRVERLSPSVPGETVTLSIRVEDTGIGMSAEQQSRLFQSFQQVHTASHRRRFGGTGLGLVIARRLAEAMGGEIRIQSEAGVGSCFTVTVQLCCAEAADEAKPQAPLKLLVVDDHPSARAVACATAAGLGWSAVSVDSGRAALDLLRAPGAEAFDAVLVDWLMPELDGFETARQIRTLGAAAPIVVMTSARGREALDAERQRPGAALDGFIDKPYTPSMLATAVLDALAGHQTVALTRPPTAQQRRLTDVRLLVVEDNPMNQQVARALLDAEGAAVTVVDGGLAALDRLTARSQAFDLVLMDLQMPDLDGLETTRRLRSRHSARGLPVVAMTANVSSEDREACLAAGMQDHVGKPFHIDQLVATILRVLGRPAGASKASTCALAAPDTGDTACDFVAALARLGGNLHLFRQQGRAFLDEAQTLADQLREHLGEKRRAEARRLSHSVKGVSGTLGLRALSATLGRVEHALGGDADPPAAEAALTELDARLAQDLPALAAHLDTLAAPTAPEPPATPSTLDPSQLAPLLHALECNDMAAFALLETLKPQLPATPDVQALIEAIEGLAFSDAARRCKALME